MMTLSKLSFVFTRTFMRRLGLVLFAVTMVANQSLLKTYADTVSCPPGMSAEDCNALYGNWPNWVPDDGSGGCGVGTTIISTTLPSSVPVAYAALFTKASQAANINPNYLAAIFVTEHGNNWPNPSGPWAGSSTGAQGPFQFEPGTWSAYKTDGDGDGTTDVQNLADAAFSAAKLLAANGVSGKTALGDIAHPWVTGTFMYAAGAYNAGGGTLQQYTHPSDPLDAPGLAALGDGGSQVKNYVANVYYLVTTSFKHGNPGYGNAAGTVADNTGGATLPAGPAGSVSSGDCSGAGAVQGNIVQTALNLAWDSRKPNQWHEADAKPSYQTTMPKVQGDNPPENYWSDCGRFVSTVMRSSGVDPNYELATTTSQLAYVKQHPDMYQVLPATSTADFHPGDILISSGHTYIFVGPQPDGTNSRSASWVGANEEYASSPDSFVPSAYTANLAGDYVIVRFIGSVNAT